MDNDKLIIRENSQSLVKVKSALEITDKLIKNNTDKIQFADFGSVQIGDQIWMKNNLNVSYFRNGDLIPEAKTDEEWRQALKESKPACCFYDNDPGYGEKYGKLYNWFSIIDPRGLAPEGWHIPSAVEFSILREYSKNDGNGLKAFREGTYGGLGTNKSGFNAFLAGSRSPTNGFVSKGTDTEFWSSSMYDRSFVYFMTLGTLKSGIFLFGVENRVGLSVRCIKDTLYKIFESQSFLADGQIWLKKNLNTDNFLNGDSILEAKSNDQWEKALNQREPAWCYFENNPENGNKFGKLYNWYAVIDPRGLAPSGWRIPTKSDFDTLTKYIYDDYDFLIKFFGTDHDKKEYSLPYSGYRTQDSYFTHDGHQAIFWSKTRFGEKRAFVLTFPTSILLNTKVRYFTYDYGYSVRCIKE